MIHLPGQRGLMRVSHQLDGTPPSVKRWFCLSLVSPGQWLLGFLEKSFVAPSLWRSDGALVHDLALIVNTRLNPIVGHSFLDLRHSDQCAVSFRVAFPAQKVGRR